MVEKIKVSIRQWDELPKSIQSRAYVEITAIHLMNRPRQYFFVIGKPMYTSPLKQVQFICPHQCTNNTRREPIFEKIQELSSLIQNQWLHNHVADESKDMQSATNVGVDDTTVQSVALHCHWI